MKKLSLLLVLLLILNLCSACGAHSSEATDTHRSDSAISSEFSSDPSGSSDPATDRDTVLVSETDTDGPQDSASVSGEGFEVLEKKYVKATLDDRFYAQKLFVTLQPAYSVTPQSAEYFSDVGCAEVLESVLQADNTRRYHLRLARANKQNILDMIALLMERDDVYSAEPDWVYVIEDIPVEELPVYEKIYVKATLEDNFSPNEVSLTLQPAYSKERQTEEYFSDVGCVKIVSNFYYPNEKYRYYWLRLDQESKQNVLDVIDVLMKRDDVVCAEPSWYVSYPDEPDGYVEPLP